MIFSSTSFVTETDSLQMKPARDKGDCDCGCVVDDSNAAAFCMDLRRVDRLDVKHVFSRRAIDEISSKDCTDCFTGRFVGITGSGISNHADVG